MSTLLEFVETSDSFYLLFCDEYVPSTTFVSSYMYIKISIIILGFKETKNIFNNIATENG